jgi:hypothetical protein
VAITRDRPRCRELDSYQPFSDAVGSWELLEAVGIVLLTFFEASLGVIAERRELESVSPFFLIFFVPYVALAWWARRRVLYANELIRKFREASAI